MNIVQAVNTKACDEVSIPAVVETLFNCDRSLAAQFDSMLDEPIARVEVLEATHDDVVATEEEEIEVERQRVLMWINWRLSNLQTIKTRLDEMEPEEAWCLNQLGTTYLRKVLDLNFVEEVSVQKYVDLNQRTTDKGKAIADEPVDESSGDDDNDNNDDNLEDVLFEIARRRSLLENYITEGERSKANVNGAAVEPATIEVYEE